MKLSALLEGIEFEAPEGFDLGREITEICYDSRKAAPGCAFLCISGTGSDGHNFVDMARRRDAAVIIAEKPEVQGDDVLHTANTRLALARMASNFYGNPARELHIIGVTGTNGKTTVTYLLKQVLEQAGHRVGLIGTIQNLIGEQVLESNYTTPEPLTLYKILRRMADAGCDYAVMEVSSHSLAQDRVGDIRFDVGIFTNLTQDHLDFHGTMENYMLAKAKLFSMCEKGVLNADDPAGRRIAALGTAACTFFSAEGQGDVNAERIDLHARGVDFDLTGGGVSTHIHLGIPGRFSVYNALAVAAAAEAIGIPRETTAEGLAKAHGVKGRAEIVPGPEQFTILIDYAHTPDGLYNILTTVKGFARGRVVAVFGCGGDRDRTKRPKMGKIGVDNADFCVITSDNPRSEDPDAIIADILTGVEGTETPYVVVANRAEAIRYAIEHAEKDDVIVLAGKGHETYQILREGTIHFDEREVVAEVLRTLHEGR